SLLPPVPAVDCVPTPTAFGNCRGEPGRTLRLLSTSSWTTFDGVAFGTQSAMWRVYVHLGMPTNCLRCVPSCPVSLFSGCRYSVVDAIIPPLAYGKYFVTDSSASSPPPDRSDFMPT